MKKYIMQGDNGEAVLYGDPSQMIDQITKTSLMAFRTRDDLRRTYASFLSDMTGNPVRFGSDNDFIEDLLDYGIIKEQI